MSARIAHLAAWSALCTGLSAHADLYAVGVSDIEVSRYYRISTLDATTELISENPDVEAMAELTLAPDGRYAAIEVTYGSLYVVDPVSAKATYVDNPFGYWWTSGALAVSPDGIAQLGGWSAQEMYTHVFQFDLATGEQGRSMSVATSPITAFEYRSDGQLIGARVLDVLAIDLATGAATLIGTLDPSHGDFVLSFARDPRTGTCYVLTREDQTPKLYEMDLYTLETRLIGALPDAFKIYGIAGIVCAADFNQDGSLSILDFVSFQLAFQAGDGAADVNGDGVLDLLDFVAFQSLFLEGCP